jgi:hypothetical protein
LSEEARLFNVVPVQDDVGSHLLAVDYLGERSLAGHDHHYGYPEEFGVIG